MTNRLEVILWNRQQAFAVLDGAAKQFVANLLQNGKTLVLTCGYRKRTSKQNKRYWGRGILAQIAEQATVGGKLFAAETWHEQFKRQFIGVIELPDGSVVGQSSTGLDTAEFCKFSDQVEAYAATELGVFFEDLAPRAWVAEAVDPETGEIC